MHRLPPRYEYQIRTGTHRAWIRVGEWYVLKADGSIETYPSSKAIEDKYELLADGTQPPTQSSVPNRGSAAP